MLYTAPDGTVKKKMEARSAGAPPPKKEGENGKKEKDVVDKGKKHGQGEEKKGTKSEEETLQELLKNGPGPDIVKDE
jgi:hypothetical protein